MEIFDDIDPQLLIARLSQGDDAAFNLVYKAYSKQLYMRIFYLVKDADITDELLQELFMKLWNKRHTLNSEKSFKAYLFTIAQNLVYNHFRKMAGERTLIQTLLQKHEHLGLSVEELFENEEAAELLQQAINQLTPQRKLVFELCKIEGKSYEETGQIMGISIATVNTHMTKSMQSIRDFLINHGAVCVILTAYMLKDV